MLNFGVVGYGYWGPNVARNVVKSSKAKLQYICDLDEKKRSRAKTEHPNVQITNNLNDLLADTTLDAILIATPTAANYELAKKCLEAGKHVMVEKPMASTTEQCLSLQRIARDNNKLLAVDHTFLFTPSVRFMKNYIEKGDLGKILYFDSERINLGIIRPDIDVIWDLAPHDLSIMLHLLGPKNPPRLVYATGASYFVKKNTELANISVTFDDGSVAYIKNSWLSPVKMRKFIIAGDKKMMLYDDISTVEKIKIFDHGVDFDLSEETSLSPIYRSGDILVPKLDQQEALALEINNFSKAILGEEDLISGAELGIQVVKILEATTRSLETNLPIELEK